MTELRFDANLGWLFTDLPFERRFDAAAQAGFQAVEYPGPYGYNVRLLRKSLADSGLTQALINSPAGQPGSATGYGSACLPDLVPSFRVGVLQAIEYAVELGGCLIHVPAGIRPPDVAQDRAFATYVKNIAWATERAADAGITLAVEAINQRDAPGFILESVEQAAEVVKAIDSPHLGLLFDVYHCQLGGGNLSHRLRELLPTTVHIQVADPPTRTEPGTGEIAWAHIFGLIRESDYAGWIGCEYRPTTTTVDGLGWRDHYATRPRGRAGPNLRVNID